MVLRIDSTGDSDVFRGVTVLLLIAWTVLSQPLHSGGFTRVHPPKLNLTSV